VRSGVDEPLFVDPVGVHHQVARGRQVAVHALALLDFFAGGRRDGRETPDRHPRPAVLSREKVPVVHRVAHYRIRDVVRGEAEGIDGQQRLPGLELGGLGVLEADLVQVVALDLEVDGSSLMSPIPPLRLGPQRNKDPQRRHFRARSRV
jgi:hypothetical protein